MRYVFGIFVLVALTGIGIHLDAQDKQAQSVCELQYSRDVCWQIFNR